MAYELTDQDKAILALVAKHEAGTYDTIYGGEQHPLTQMLIGEVLQFQNTYMRGWASTAVGKYQMLKAVVEEACRRSKFDPTQVRYTEEVQDIMMIDKIKAQRKYNDWKAGSLGATVEENCQVFMEYLAAEWASCPVPYDMPAGSSRVSSRHPRRSLLKGQSFYAGDGLNKSHHDPDQFLSALVDIYNGGPGEVTEIPSTSDEGYDPRGRNQIPGYAAPANSQGHQQQGNTQQQRMQNFGSGGSRVTGGTGNRPALPNNLPAASDVYKYEIIDPLDDRYDFRTGKKVSRLLENGTASTQSNAPGSTNTPGGDLGVAPNNGGLNPETFTMDQVNEALDNRDASSTQAGRYSDNPSAPAQTNPVTAPSSSASSSNSNVNAGGSSNSSASGSIGSADGLSGKLAPIKKIPNPLGTDANGIPTGLGKSGIGSLKPPSKVVGNDPSNTSKPGLSNAPAEPVDDTGDPNTIIREKSIELQEKLDGVKAQIKQHIQAIREIVDAEPEVFLQEMINRRDDLEDDAVLLESDIENAPVGSTERSDLERQLFTTNSAISVLNQKISMGSPYGLTINTLQSRVKAKDSYQENALSIRALLIEVDGIKKEASTSGVDLKGANYTRNYQTIPPVVTFTDN
jgi:muramidase (phage lysozyme)